MVWHMANVTAASLKTPIYMTLQFKNYLIVSYFASLTLHFQVANTFPCCYLFIWNSSTQYGIKKIL